MCIINNKREGTLKALMGTDLPNVDSPVRPSNVKSNTPRIWLLLFLCIALYDCLKTEGNIIQDQMVRLPGHPHW